MVSVFRICNLRMFLVLMICLQIVRTLNIISFILQLCIASQLTWYYHFSHWPYVEHLEPFPTIFVAERHVRLHQGHWPVIQSLFIHSELQLHKVQRVLRVWAWLLIRRVFDRHQQSNVHVMFVFRETLYTHTHTNKVVGKGDCIIY